MSWQPEMIAATRVMATSLAIAGVVLLAVAATRRKSKRLTFHQHWVRKTGLKSFERELVVAVDLAVACGEAMLETAGAKASMKDGQNGIDPQTATDLSNERLVMDTLQRKFPEHGLIGEETAAAAGKVPMIEARPTWIVDPIDGTQNFCSGLPIAAVSIGLCIEGKPVLGVIYDPYRGTRFLRASLARAHTRASTLPGMPHARAYTCIDTTRRASASMQMSSLSASPPNPPLSTACSYMGRTAT